VLYFNVKILNVSQFLQVDPSGPLATLRQLLLSEKSIASLKKFLTQYWYTVIFIVLGVLILMVRNIGIHNHPNNLLLFVNVITYSLQNGQFRIIFTNTFNKI
jgi:hypothetical protein